MTQCRVSQYVVNLSTHTLTPAQISLLNKGLTFCPTPGRLEQTELRKDLEEFHRKLRWRHHHDDDNPFGASKNPYFSDSQGPSQPINPYGDKLGKNGGFSHRLFKPKSPWAPKGAPALEAFIHQNLVDLLDHVDYKRPKDNLSPDERQALKDLKRIPDLIVKKADKGSAVVLQDLNFYVKEGQKQLSDRAFYHEIPFDCTDTNKAIIDFFVREMMDNGEIDEPCFKSLTRYKPRTAKFYKLPKIHKGKLPPPGRPIISGNGCPTEQISRFVDHFIKRIPLWVDPMSKTRLTLSR